MKRGNKKVDQITKDGLLVTDYDLSLSKNEMFKVLEQHFNGLKKMEGSPEFYIGEYKGHRYAIRCKNVTYLGNPHPGFKKRIQIADDLSKFYETAKNLKRKSMLLGIYTYADNTIFVHFSIDTYIKKAAHNSSAHIYSSDLAIAAEDGFFEKVDYFGNTVTAFRPDVVDVFLNELFCGDGDGDDVKGVAEKDAIWDFAPQDPVSRVHSFDETSPEMETDSTNDQNDESIYEKKSKENILREIESFFVNERKHWYGIECYQEMIENQYRNKYQPEWVGFYLEYKFEKYLSDHHLQGVIQYYQDKKSGGIDLDLFFPQLNSYGDLKAHSEGSGGIQGNDWDTVLSIVGGQNPENHIYYIVCEHATEKDHKYDYEVTKFWNQSQNKSDLMSYHKRTKNNVTLKKVYILDINHNNKKYLTKFKQGINSNGKPREPKIMIEHENLKYFIIDEITL